MHSRLRLCVAATALAAVLVAAGGLAAAAATAASSATQAEPSSLFAEIVISPAEQKVPLVDRLITWAKDSYAREPELTAAIAGIGILLPVVSFGALAFAWGARRAKSDDIGSGHSRSARPWRDATHVMPQKGANAKPHALFRVEGEPTTELPISGNMVRIGRHEENDIRLQSKTVHRYHAVMHVTPERDYVITDLSGEEGNGVIVNGRRIEQTTLKGEDLIELGETRLRFQVREVGSRA